MIFDLPAAFPSCPTSHFHQGACADDVWSTAKLLCLWPPSSSSCCLRMRGTALA